MTGPDPQATDGMMAYESTLAMARRVVRRRHTMVPGGSHERAAIFREALAAGRTVSVGYRRGGMLEVRDLTDRSLWWITYDRPMVMA